VSAVQVYDVIIIGAGPAGIFTALELSNKGLSSLVLEKGRDITKRSCPINSGKSKKCAQCQPCDIVCGWGGAGAFSDGKLTLTTDFGGILDQYLSTEDLATLIDYVDQIYLRFGATLKVYGDDHQAAIRQIQRNAAAADLSFIPARIRHFGTENCREILIHIWEYLATKCMIRSQTAVQEILVDEGHYRGVELASGEVIHSKYLVVAPGREGSEWFACQAKKLGLSMETNPVDLGVRVELPAVVMEHITEVVYESKFIYYTKSFDDRVRTFCMNPYGEVVTENNSGLITVNGHSYTEQRTENTNFALLVSKSFTQPFKDPITYGKSIANLANLLGGGVIVQRLGDLLDGRRSTPERMARGLVRATLSSATPGDLSLVFPYRFLTAIMEMLENLDKVAPGVNSRHTLLYGVEAKFYSSRVSLTPKLESQIQNLFAIGDGAGVTRGLAQASATGVIVAREILYREA
jgi:uncharacterized FAD-dependent dehydrogenase